VAEAWLEQLEATVADSDVAIAVATVAAVAGRDIEVDEDELEDIRTVGDAFALVERLVAAKG
jgi:hypothetical protein